jgi:hypothetical protein
MDIEIGRSVEEDRISGALELVTEKHEVLPDGEWIRAVRRRCERDDLFVYFHKVERKFIVAQWAVPPYSRSRLWCYEIESLDRPPDQGGAPSMRMMELRCRPLYVELRARKEAIRRRKAEKQRLRDETFQEREDAVRYLRRRGMDEAAARVKESPYVGTSEGGERLEELKEEMTRTARERVYAH